MENGKRERLNVQNLDDAEQGNDNEKRSFRKKKQVEKRKKQLSKIKKWESLFDEGVQDKTLTKMTYITMFILYLLILVMFCNNSLKNNCFYLCKTVLLLEIL